MSSYTPRLKKILKAHKCYLFQTGKGRSRVLVQPINGHKFVVDSNIRSRDMANVVLKQAGIIDERFE